MKSRSDIFNLLEKHRTEIKAFGVLELGIFGSFAREEQTDKSDVDVLVEMESRTFDAYMDLLFFLEDLFGRRVDLVVKDTIKPIIRNRVLREAVYVSNL